MKTKKMYYGTIVVICCTLLAFSVNAMGNNSLSFYVVPVSKAFDVNRATTNFSLFTTGLITRTILGLFFGKLSARFGIKPLMIVGVVFVLASFMMYSFAGNILMIELGTALYGIAHAIGTFSSYNVIVNNWFKEKKGLVLGILNTAVGIGGMVINPLVGGWIERYGWNQSFLNTMLLIAAIAIPSVIFIKESPQKMKNPVISAQQQPSNMAAKLKKADFPQESYLTVRRAIYQKRFWLLAAIQLLIGFSTGPCFSNAIPAVRSMGVDPHYVSSVLSVIMAFGITVGNILSGLIYDKFGLGPLMNATVGIVGISTVCIGVLATNPPAVLLILAMFGIGYGNALTLGTLSHMINDVFKSEHKDFSGLFGFLFAVQNIGVMIGSPISGMFFDKTGNYQMSYLISAALLIVMLILMHVAIKSGKQKLHVDQLASGETAH